MLARRATRGRRKRTGLTNNARTAPAAANHTGWRTPSLWSENSRETPRVRSSEAATPPNLTPATPTGRSRCNADGLAGAPGEGVRGHRRRQCGAAIPGNVERAVVGGRRFWTGSKLCYKARPPPGQSGDVTPGFEGCPHAQRSGMSLAPRRGLWPVGLHEQAFTPALALYFRHSGHDLSHAFLSPLLNRFPPGCGLDTACLGYSGSSGTFTSPAIRQISHDPGHAFLSPLLNCIPPGLLPWHRVPWQLRLLRDLHKLCAPGTDFFFIPAHSYSVAFTLGHRSEICFASLA